MFKLMKDQILLEKRFQLILEIFDLHSCLFC
jgi:hypothetical protein